MKRVRQITTLALLLIILSVTVSPAVSSPVEAPPYPQSPVIKKLTWAPAGSVVRAAPGGDTWPLTWADDNNLYTAYGDGRGFKPRAPQKLSLGFSLVSGTAAGFTGKNIPSNGEQKGDGENGKKASSLLMVNGVLYMWVRNANNDGEQCQLAWSTDHAKTWSWSSWKFAEFGYCTFINYGKNYAGARDSYVYMVTPNGPSAYNPANDFVLLRVPKDQIKNRNAYQFFVRRDAQGSPVWSSKIADRKPVFSNPGAARRSSITYNAALGRYLWWQGIPHSGDEKKSGGFGIYDAPEPWGPWTTVYYTSKWDMGPGETASFPTKWMSADGKTLYLVFSGEDSFSVRKATLEMNSVSERPNLPENAYLPSIHCPSNQ